MVNLNALPSFSQVGEDIIVHHLFRQLKIEYPTYLEIGTNLPVRGNNTYFFYNRGCRGVCIEPDRALYNLIRKKRRADTVLNIGIGLAGATAAVLHIFPDGYTGWNTFSPEEALIREKESGIRIKTKVEVPLRTVNDIMSNYFNPAPNFISIDVEGLDLAILQSLDFDRFKPEVFCVETISFSVTNKEEKLHDIIEFMHSKGYFSYADTHVNTIFCRTDLFKSGQ